MTKQILTGEIPDKEDPRDYPVSSWNVSKELQEVDLTDYVLYIRNQDYNDCVINSFNGLFEIEYHLKFDKKLTFLKTKGLSNGYGYTIARQKMKTFPFNTGLYPREVVKQYNKLGIAPEHLMPYDKYKLDSVPDFKANFSANFFKVKSYESILPDQIPYVLSANKPIQIAINLDGNFLGYKRGTILRESDGKNLGGHAMVCVGQHFEEDGTIVLKILNSWGPWLGDHGYWYMTLDYLKHCAGNRHFWIVNI